MREPKPFFRKQTGTWYVQIGKQQHNLGPDEQVAKQKYHALMAGRQPVTDESSVYSVLFQFLGWNKQHREGSTHEFYKRHIVSFAEFIGETLAVGQLKPFHVTNWVNESYPKTGCGRDRPFGRPPAQIRTCRTTAYGSYFGCLA